MSRVQQSVVINSDPQRVMEYISNVQNHPAFIGPLKSVTNLRGDAKQKGTTWDWKFVMAGVEFAGKSETVEYVPGRQFSFKTTTGIHSTFNYRLEPAQGGSRLTIDVDYEVPKTLLAKLQTSVVERLNDAEGQAAVQNLKAILDT